LVVRLEDQFGNPMPAETVTGTIIQGEGTLLPVTTGGVPVSALAPQLVQSSTSTPVRVATDATGTAAFRLIAGTSGSAIAVEAKTLDLPAVPPVQFLTIVGLIQPSSIAVETNGHLVVVDRVLRAVVRIDPVRGTSSIVSGATRGQGPLWGNTFSHIAVEADGHLVVTDLQLGILRVDPRTGDRTIVPAFLHPLSIGGRRPLGGDGV
jgi:streptogramin lyase